MKPQHTRIAAYGLIEDSGRLLLCRISNEIPKWQGYWTLPGGGIEFGEHPEQAMIREVREETGLEVIAMSIAQIDSFVDLSGEKDHHGLRIIYRARVTGGSLKNELTGTTDLCDWHTLHPTPEIPLVDLAEVGVRVAQSLWPK